MSLLTVSLGERSYPICIQTGLLQQPQLVNQYLPYQHLVVVTNPTVRALYGAKLAAACPHAQWIEIPDGEAYKTLQSFEQIMTTLLDMHAARDTCLVALGGGVIGDLTGFAAACYQRGIPFVQIPTTLLSQVDSSVGGKTAVNHPLGKNMIGAFYQPQAVLIDIDSLHTLPPREFAAGMAEVIKYGIIYDAAFFAWLENNVGALKALEPEAIRYAVQRSCEIKAEVVAADETEQNIRAILNLGHTFGHAIEAEMGFGTWLHGEAVATGMIIAAQASAALGWMSASEVRRISDLIAAFDLPVKAPAHMGYAQFIQHMRHDKKVKQGAIRFVIADKIGHAVITELPEPLLRDILAE